MERHCTQGSCLGCYLGLTLTRLPTQRQLQGITNKTIQKSIEPANASYTLHAGLWMNEIQERLLSWYCCTLPHVLFRQSYRLHQMPCAIFLFSTPQGDRLNHSSHSATPMTLPPRCAECPMPSFHPCTHPMASNPAKPPISSRAGIP